MAVFDYTPPPTLARFMASDARVRIVRGPVGSGKSTAMVMELLRRACQQAPDADGIRRTRAVIVRNTLSQLETTCLVTIQKTLRPLVKYKVSPHTVEIRFNDVHTEWILLPLDTPENVQRLLSLEITFAWLSELREIPVSLVSDVLSRCGRYPTPLAGGAAPTWHGVFGETNSFSEDSDWYKALELEKKPSWDYFVQPGARDPGAEKPPGLPPNYYEDLLENNPPEWSDQYVDNLVTPSLSGQAVFRTTFKSDFHVAKSPLTPEPGALSIIGMDFGRSPAAVLTQMDVKGRLLILAELTSDNMGIEQFVATKLRPMLNEPRFSRLALGCVGDPAGRAKGQIGEESVFDVLKRLGIPAQPALTNNIDPRLRSVEKWLLQQRDGGPALIIDPGCVVLIQAMKSMYRYPRKKDGSLVLQPEKTHPWSDVCFTAGTLVATPCGNVPIETLVPGDVVLVADGLDVVTHAASREVHATDLVELVLSDGTRLTCTKEHPFAVNNPSCFLPADELSSTDRLVAVEETVWASGVDRTRASVLSSASAARAIVSLLRRPGAWLRARPDTAASSAGALDNELMMALRLMAYGSPDPVKTGTTGTRSTAFRFRSTSIYGRSITVPYQWATRYTTEITTPPTTPLKTSYWSNVLSMLGTTSCIEYGPEASIRLSPSSTHERRRRSGMDPQKAARGTASMPSRSSLNVVGKVYPSAGDVVYNLKTLRTSTYFAGGVLVHNCDALQYACLGYSDRILTRFTRPRRQVAAPVPTAGWT